MLKLTRWTIAHRRIVVAAWIVLAVGIFAISQAVGNRNANNFSLPNTDSQRAIDLLQSRFPAQAGDADQIVFRTRGRLMTPFPAQHEAERLLDQIRARVAELDRLDQTLVDRSEVRRRRREITELRWQLARVISDQPDGGNVAA